MNHHRSQTALALALASTLALTGCGGSYNAKFDAPRVAGPAPAEPQVLKESLFSKDPSGAIGETDLQKVLTTPIDLQFPARVGVVPLAKPFDPRETATVAQRSTAAEELARSLAGTDVFTHVSDVSTELPNQGGIEGLRALAARYRLRYLVLYSERFEDETHLNGWAWLYPTFIGMFAAPGVTIKSRGLLQADLLDVRTGSILFTVVQPLQASAERWITDAGRAHKEIKIKVAKDGAKLLAKHVLAQTHELLAYAEDKLARDKQAKVRIMPAPVNDPVAPPPPPAVLPAPIPVASQ